MKTVPFPLLLTALYLAAVMFSIMLYITVKIYWKSKHLEQKLKQHES